MRNVAVLLLACIAVAGADKDAADCSKVKAELAAVKKEAAASKKEEQKLKGDIEAAKSKLTGQVAAAKAVEDGLQADVQKEKSRAKKLEQQLKEVGSGPQEHSVGALLHTMRDVSAGSLQGLLDMTTLDEKMVDTSSKAKDFTFSAAHAATEQATTAMNMLSSIDYTTQYRTHLAPHVGVVGGLVDAHLGSHLEAVKGSPAFAAAYLASASAYDTVRVGAGAGGSAAYEHISGVAAAAPGLMARLRANANLGLVFLEGLLDSAFSLFSRAAPHQAQSLPKDPVDRALLLLLSIVLFFNLLALARWSLKLIKLVLRFLKLVLRFKKCLVVLCIKTPFKVLFKVLSWALFFATGFYCCGLCRSRKAKDTQAKGAKKNGAPKHATTAQVVQLLQKSKDKKKLADGAKALCALVKKGAPVNGSSPPEMQGLIITKDTLKQALQKFKEVDVKTLDL